MKKYSFIYRNGLCIVFLILMVASLIGQIFTGWWEHNEFLNTYGRPSQNLETYLCTGHFLQATFENWESEFLQMALFVVLTIFLRQQGSSESKKCEEECFDKTELQPKEESPWSVKKGGFYLLFYKHSLTISLCFLYVLSFLLHWWLDFNEKQELLNKSTTPFFEYLDHKKLWFESFQNWQSEFLSIFAIIFLSIYLRQHGSSQSKAVNDPHHKTGEC